ncbi:chaoptin [Galendromus occidentalis]|uniref:Chaoptin n=1 Tax=Galendromus occidentalis TaxID=34638 RepID=A0AAJ7SJQ8_9ACAR|nr:chaoptin [Galendromus occidentalis]
MRALNLFSLYCVFSLKFTVDAATIQECDFMPQCTCTQSMVTCVGLRIFSLKDVFEKPDHPTEVARPYNQIVVSRSGLLHIDWAPQNVVTLSLPKNHIYEVHSRSLNGSRETLSSLDLSDNALSDVPNLNELKQLRWLNLQRNQFSEVPPSVRETNLTTLLLSGNFIRTIAVDQFPRSLTTLHMESNQIISVEGHAVPAGLRLLNLGNNFIHSIPHNFHRSSSLERLILSNNVIQRLRSHWKLPKSLEDLDLSRGSLRELDDTPLGLSSDSLSDLRALHLEFNFITRISEKVFEGVHLKKLFLNSNRLIQLPQRLFDGAIATSLLVLDLSENQFEFLPICVSFLKSLRTLLVKGNRLATFEFPVPEPMFANSLQILDLAHNKLTEIPPMLSNTSSLIRLNFQGNDISSLGLLSRGKWSSKLQSLILSNNAIKTVSHEDFSKMIALKELKLSANNVRYLDPASFESLKALQALEMSSCLASDISMERLSKLLKPLGQLRLLQVDYNRIYGNDVLTQSLVNVDFDGNDLKTTPSLPAVSKIARVSFNYNGIRILKKNSIRNVSTLEQFILIGNPLREIESDAFNGLGSLVSVILSSNRILTIRSGSFRNLPCLQRIHLDNNSLQHLNLDMFRAAGRRLLLNASTNFIENILAANEPVDTRIVDLSQNELTSLSNSFWDSTERLVQLFASRNRISRLSPGKTVHEKLSVVDLSWNRLTADAVLNLSLIAPNLEELYLRGNNLESIGSAEDAAMNNLRNWRLRVLDVSSNFIQRLESGSLPSRLQMLNVSGNPLKVFNIPENSLQLSSLDISDTNFRLGADWYLGERLQMLNVSSTKTQELSSESLPPSLLLLEAFGCNLKSISLNSPRLIELKLRNASLPSRTMVHAPRLRHLDLAHNAIRNVTALLGAFPTERLRILNIEHNAIDKISPDLWRNSPVLHTLDMSSNPVDVLGAHTFRGLGHLADLDMRNLSLVRLDSRLLKQVPCLSTLRISTYNKGIRSLRLQELLAESQLQRAVVEVGEPVLSYQLQWAFDTKAKLRELHVTGAPLRLILPDAFQGLESVHELSLRITHTSISELPPGLLRYLTNIRYLSLDLRYNRLQSLSPTVLDSKRLRPAHRETQLLPGGLRVDGNPWHCSCDLAWLASWLRRWIRETGRLQRFEASTALQLHQTVRRATCYLPGGRSTPIVDFSFEEMNCATTAASTNSAYLRLPDFLCCFGFAILTII